MAFAAVGFFHRDLEIAAAAGRVEVVNFERPRCNRVLINDVTVLADHYQRVAVGGAANNGGIAFLTVRQHVVIGFQLYAGIGHAVKNVGRRGALANGEVAFHRHNIALRIGINGGEFVLLLVTRGAAIPGGIVTYPPGTDVQTGTQVDVLATVILLPLLARMALAGICAVVKQACVDPFVKLFRVDVTARHLAQRRLGNAQQQLLIAHAKGRGSRRNSA